MIQKITGHSNEVLNRHFDRSDIKKRGSEITSRSYNKSRDVVDKQIELNNLPSEPNSQIEYTTELFSTNKRRLIKYNL